MDIDEMERQGQPSESVESAVRNWPAFREETFEAGGHEITITTHQLDPSRNIFITEATAKGPGESAVVLTPCLESDSRREMRATHNEIRDSIREMAADVRPDGTTGLDAVIDQGSGNHGYFTPFSEETEFGRLQVYVDTAIGDAGASNLIIIGLTPADGNMSEVRIQEDWGPVSREGLTDAINDAVSAASDLAGNPEALETEIRENADVPGSIDDVARYVDADDDWYDGDPPEYAMNEHISDLREAQNTADAGTDQPGGNVGSGDAPDTDDVGIDSQGSDIDLEDSLDDLVAGNGPQDGSVALEDGNNAADTGIDTTDDGIDIENSTGSWERDLDEMIMENDAHAGATAGPDFLSRDEPVAQRNEWGIFRDTVHSFAEGISAVSEGIPEEYNLTMGATTQETEYGQTSVEWRISSPDRDDDNDNWCLVSGIELPTGDTIILDVTEYDHPYGDVFNGQLENMGNNEYVADALQSRIEEELDRGGLSGAVMDEFKAEYAGAVMDEIKAEQSARLEFLGIDPDIPTISDPLRCNYEVETSYGKVVVDIAQAPPSEGSYYFVGVSLSEPREMALDSGAYSISDRLSNQDNPYSQTETRSAPEAVTAFREISGNLKEMDPEERDQMVKEAIETGMAKNMYFEPEEFRDFISQDVFDRLDAEGWNYRQTDEYGNIIDKAAEQYAEAIKAEASVDSVDIPDEAAGDTEPAGSWEDELSNILTSDDSLNGKAEGESSIGIEESDSSLATPPGEDPEGQIEAGDDDDTGSNDPEEWRATLEISAWVNSERISNIMSGADNDDKADSDNSRNDTDTGVDKSDELAGVGRDDDDDPWKVD